jgi:hypothetical protein
MSLHSVRKKSTHYNKQLTISDSLIKGNHDLVISRVCPSHSCQTLVKIIKDSDRDRIMAMTLSKSIVQTTKRRSNKYLTQKNTKSNCKMIASEVLLSISYTHLHQV